jgi:hypothetical protein
MILKFGGNRARDRLRRRGLPATLIYRNTRQRGRPKRNENYLKRMFNDEKEKLVPDARWWPGTRIDWTTGSRRKINLALNLGASDLGI